MSRSDNDSDLKRRAAEHAAQVWLSRILEAEDETVALNHFEQLARSGNARALTDVAKRSKNQRVRAAAVARLEEPRLLAEVVRSASDGETWSQALQRISDETVLRTIAIEDQRRDVALAALELIKTNHEVETVAVKSKHRPVRWRAHQRIAVDQAGLVAPVDDVDGKRAHAERSQLIRQVEEVVESHDWLRARNVIESCEVGWAVLGDGDDQPLTDRMKSAVAKFHERFERYGAAAVAEAEAREAREAKAAAQPARADKPLMEPPPELEPAEAEEEEDEPPPAAVELKPELSPEEKRAANLADFQAFTQRLLDIAAKVDKIKTADKWLSRSDEKLAELGPLPDGEKKAAMEKFAEARRALFIRAGELREVDEWKRWANVPKQEELIGKVAALIGTEDRRSLAKQLKDIQNEWRDVGPAPRDKAQELWKKFKDTCDQVYEQVKEQRAGDAEVQKANLEKKLVLCERAEELSKSTDWGPTAEQFKHLQAEWKSIGPVPRRQSDKIWKRFRTACDAFFEARRPHVERAIEEFSENLAQKTALCEEVEALAESNEEPDQAMRKLSEFRRRFRDIGQVSRRDYRTLLERFNTACDRVAGKRDELLRKQETEKRDAVSSQLSALEAALAGDPSSPEIDVVDITVKLRAARRELLGAKRVEKEDRELGAKAAELVVRAVETVPDRFKGTELDPDTSKKRKEKLLAKVEKLVAQKNQASGNNANLDMAAKLKAALADRALGGILSKNDTRVAAETVQEARESWARLGPVPGPDGQALEERFRAACKRALGDSEASRE